jgi:hypothetical protein
MKAYIASVIADALADTDDEWKAIESTLLGLPTARLFSTPAVFIALGNDGLVPPHIRPAASMLERNRAEDAAAAIRKAIRKAREFIARQSSFDLSAPVEPGVLEVFADAIREIQASAEFDCADFADNGPRETPLHDMPRVDALEAGATIVREIERELYCAERSETGEEWSRVASLETQALAIFAALKPTREEFSDLEIPAFLRR